MVSAMIAEHPGAAKRHTPVMDQPDEPVEPVEVPHTLLSVEALRGVVEAFVLREGTDYGAHEFTHEQKVQQVLDGLRRGESRIVYNPQTSSVTLLPID